MKYFAIAALGAVLATGAVATPKAADDAAYRKQIDDWRAKRVERLKAPNGWLSLVGLEWLKEGANTIGSAKDNAIVIAKAPPHLGTVVLDRGRATISLDPRARDAKIDGESKPGAELVDDSQEKPTTVSFGSANFYLIKRDDKFGLRIKDTAAPTRTHFVGIDNFDIDPSWRIEAKWEAYDPPHEIEQGNILGQIEKAVVPGAAVFEHDGKTYRVEPIIENPGDTDLFLVFADRTSGKETYGAARFLYAAAPKDGKVLLDFNKAYNPPCAFTPYATCPLPTQQNRLDVRVTAGEKKYRGGHE
ncbi:MAG: DUF1684 domain-containing protein [Rudaea sp.]|uniref:DUF1684 domain-containing protein n=1 Tax=unclassified Rudaea TaxID=2627037 RepID=UPI0010F945CC|nr:MULTISPECIES: DUF1684 domain-containing protein [unclassified Rudaea]MBN8886727.1 DUF1684 domain-containing protein [Rudaea sp.]MBR0345832.1 DUF1684 domain-containing protein [Rudaea sp.]